MKDITKAYKVIAKTLPEVNNDWYGYIRGYENGAIYAILNSPGASSKDIIYRSKPGEGEFVESSRIYKYVKYDKQITEWIEREIEDMFKEDLTVKGTLPIKIK